MTSVFGLNLPGVEMAVLAADRQSSYGPHKTPTKKHLGRKLWTSKDGFYSFGHSGTRDERFGDFVSGMVDGSSVDMQRVIGNGYFPELRKLNLSRMGRKLPNLQELSSFLLITRFDNNPKLYTCWPLGDVEEREVTFIGSGSEKLEQYVSALNTLSEARNYANTGEPMDSDDVIRIALEGLSYAQGNDIYSSGLDLVIATPDRMHDHFQDLQDDLGRRIKKVQKIHRSKEK